MFNLSDPIYEGVVLSVDHNMIQFSCNKRSLQCSYLIEEPLNINLKKQSMFFISDLKKELLLNLALLKHEDAEWFMRDLSNLKEFLNQVELDKQIVVNVRRV